MQSPGDVIAEQGEGAVAEQGSTADRQLWAADSLGSRAGGSSFPLPGTSVQEREETTGAGAQGVPGSQGGRGGLRGHPEDLTFPLSVSRTSQVFTRAFRLRG